MEVIQMVMEYLNAEELKALRLASSIFGEAGRYLLFRNVNVTELSESFIRLRHVISEIEERNKTTHVSVQNLNYMPFSINRKVQRFDFFAEDIPGLLFNEYQNLIADRETLAEDAENIHQLAFAIAKLRPKSISISPQLTSAQDTLIVRERPHEIITDAAAFSYPIVPGSHKIFNELKHQRMFDSGQATKRVGCFTRSFLAVLFALHESGVQITSLEATTGLAFLKKPSTGFYDIPRSGLADLKILKLKLLTTHTEGADYSPSCLDPKSGEPWDNTWDSNLTLFESLAFVAPPVIPEWAMPIKDASILGDFLSEAPVLEQLELEIVSEGPGWDNRMVEGSSVRGNDEIKLLGEHCWKHRK